MCCEKKIRRIKLAYYSASLMAFLGGAAIYAFFRDINKMAMFQFFSKPSFINNLYTSLQTDSIWNYMFIYNLPYGLWCLSGLLLVRAIWLENTKWRRRYNCIFIITVMSYVALKLPGITPGTFDVLDLLFMGFFAFLESIIFILFIRRNLL